MFRKNKKSEKKSEYGLYGIFFTLNGIARFFNMSRNGLLLHIELLSDISEVSWNNHTYYSLADCIKKANPSISDADAHKMVFDFANSNKRIHRVYVYREPDEF